MMDCIKPSNVISKQAGKVRRRVGNRISPRTRLIIWSSVVIGLLVFVIFSPRLAPYDPYAIDLKNTLTGPSELHRLGTDYTGTDDIPDAERIF